MNNNPIFDEFEKGEATNNVFNNVYFGQIFEAGGLNGVNVDDIQTSIDLSNRPIFIEGVVARLHALGVECGIDDTETILEEVKRRYKDRIGEDCRTIWEWLRGTPPSTNNRKNNYNLCYALEMTLQETAEFFLKCFLTVPFNYKDRTDAVFFYCLSHNKPYSVIKSMLEKAEGFSSSQTVNTQTLQIGRQILEIDDDEEFLQYLSLHCYDNEQQYQLAREEIVNLIDLHSNGNFSGFHEELMGFNYQYAKRQHKKINKELPSHFIESLPTDGVLKQIYEGKKVSYETIRKALIILQLYDFYKDVYEENERHIKNYLEDFYTETNALLMKCGLAHLYVRHPFDWIIIFCALSTEPLEVFRDLSSKRYV